MGRGIYFTREVIFEVMKDALTILEGDVLDRLRDIPDESVQCVVTSPPYWMLRDYGVEGQIGLEPTFAEYIEKMVHVFREVRRVLKKDGTCWINMGDNYWTGSDGGSAQGKTGQRKDRRHSQLNLKRNILENKFKPKDMIGQPWRLAFALQDDGWWLRQDIIWHKPSPMPESVKDRCTKAHEYIFLMTKSERYYFDQEAIREPVSGGAHRRSAAAAAFPGQSDRDDHRRRNGVNPKAKIPAGWDTRTGTSHKEGFGRYPRPKQNSSFAAAVVDLVDNRNKRSVWTVASEPFKDAHFATFPGALIRPCILAGSRPGDTVLDIFGGSGTTGKEGIQLGRRVILIELNPKYVKLMPQRCAVTVGLGI